MTRESNTLGGTGQSLYGHAKRRIPGGTQLLTKRPEMFLPEQWPAYYEKAQGARVWDLDGNVFVDTSYNGVGACVLGHADPDVNDAVKTAVDHGSMSTLNCREEVDLADLLCELHPWADMARYTRSGGEAMAVAVRIARAHTGRDKIVFCGYHGWHDWYLAANLGEVDALDGHLLSGLSTRGVPRGLKGTIIPFTYGDVDSLRRVLDEKKGDVAAVVMEPVRSLEPLSGYLDAVREVVDEARAVLVFDEITAGFRITCGGSHLAYGVEPDIAVFAKALGNGFPIGAIIGREDVMQSAQTTFISSTSWTERIGPTAALATIRKFRANSVERHLVKIGTGVQRAWENGAANSGLPISVSGLAPLLHFQFKSGPGGVKSLFTKLMLQRGYLATTSFYATYAHTEADVEDYGAAVVDVFQELAEAIVQETVSDRLGGPQAHSGFQRLT